MALAMAESVEQAMQANRNIYGWLKSRRRPARLLLAERNCRRTCCRHRLEVAALGGLHGAQEAPQAALVLVDLGVLRGQVQCILLPIQHLQQPQLVSACHTAHTCNKQ